MYSHENEAKLSHLVWMLPSLFYRHSDQWEQRFSSWTKRWMFKHGHGLFEPLRSNLNFKKESAALAPKKHFLVFLASSGVKRSWSTTERAAEVFQLRRLAWGPFSSGAHKLKVMLFTFFLCVCVCVPAQRRRTGLMAVLVKQGHNELKCHLEIKRLMTNGRDLGGLLFRWWSRSRHGWTSL